MAARVADLVARLKNGYRASLSSVMVENSLLNKAILNSLWKEGYISEYKINEPTDKEAQSMSWKDAHAPSNLRNIDVSLKYRDSRPVVNDIFIVSKPGRRKFVSFEELAVTRMHGGLGVYIVSSSEGVMTDAETLRKRAGGELLLGVY
eukprot:CFRG3552T1